MKLHLPKLLALAMLSVMCAGVAYASEPEINKVDKLITDSLPTDTTIDTTGGYVIAKDGTDIINVTSEKEVTGSLYVREGGVNVKDATLSVAPASGNVTVGALNVAGKNSSVTLDNAKLYGANIGCIYVGGLDGNGSLIVDNKSLLNCELNAKGEFETVGGDRSSNTFTIGVSEIDLSAKPQGSTKNADTSEAYSGTYSDAKNGSDIPILHSIRFQFITRRWVCS